MAVPLSWADGDEAPSAPSPPTSLVSRGRPGGPTRAVVLPHAVESAVWRGDTLGSPVTRTLSSGFQALDAQLPGGGWPCGSLTEVLQVQSTVLEWRLFAPSLRALAAHGKQVVVVGPPKAPHVPGLVRLGLEERQLVWIQADKPLERLWAIEQLVKADAAGMVLGWVPQARQEQIRRLQVCAQGCEAPVILFRPAAAAHEASAAPLRLQARMGIDWELRVHLLKRKGPSHDSELSLPSIPGGLEDILTPRLQHPSRLIAARHSRESSHAVGRTSSGQAAGRSEAAH